MGNEDIILLSDSYSREPGILSDYLDYLYSIKKLAPKTAYNYYMCLRTLAKFMKHRRKNMDCAPDEVIMKSVSMEEMQSITQDEWYSFLDYCEFVLKESSGSLAVRISVVRGFYKWMSAEHDFPMPSYIKNTVRPEPLKKDYITVTPKMEATIMENLDGEFLMRNACIIRLFLHCGIGLQEICDLKMEDIEMHSISIGGENGRKIPLDEKTEECINNYLGVREPPTDGENTFFTSAKRGRMRTCSVEKMIRRAVKRAGPTLTGVTVRDMQLTAKNRIAKELSPEDAFNQSNVKSPHYFKKAFLAKA